MASSVSSTDSASSVNYVGNKAGDTSSGLTVDTDTFLKLLVAQLEYQDPLEPQTDTQFVTQLAQMSTMEQMQEMNQSLSSSQAFDMIGKYVYAEILNEDTGVTDTYLGLVDSVVIKDGEAYVIISDNAIPASNVLRVYGASEYETETEAAAAAAASG